MPLPGAGVKAIHCNTPACRVRGFDFPGEWACQMRLTAGGSSRGGLVMTAAWGGTDSNPGAGSVSTAFVRHYRGGKRRPQTYFSEFDIISLELGSAGHVEVPDQEAGANHPPGAHHRGLRLHVVQHLDHALVEPEVTNAVGHLPLLDREEAVPGHPREGNAF